MPGTDVSSRSKIANVSFDDLRQDFECLDKMSGDTRHLFAVSASISHDIFHCLVDFFLYLFIKVISFLIYAAFILVMLRFIWVSKHRYKGTFFTSTNFGWVLQHLLNLTTYLLSNGQTPGYFSFSLDRLNSCSSLYINYMFIHLLLYRNHNSIYSPMILCTCICYAFAIMFIITTLICSLLLI